MNRAIGLLVAGTVLQGCAAGPDDGKESAGSTGTTGEPQPGSVALELRFSPIKQFEFHWAPVAGAEYYQLLERVEPNGDYISIADDIVDESISLTMPLHLRFTASYVLRACRAAVCVESAPVEVADSLAGAVGYIKASNTDPEDQFGFSVALSADGATLAIGAPYEDGRATGIVDENDDSAESAGAVYVFAHAGAAWSQQAYIKASNADVGDAFGHGVALSADGNTLAVGAPYEDGGASGIGGDQADGSRADSGAVYLFTRQGSAWTQRAYVKAENPSADDGFGVTVALSSDGAVLAVGAPAEDGASVGVDGNSSDDSAPEAGAVYVFVRAAEVWSQWAYVKASNTEAAEFFGGSLALSGDGRTLAVGAAAEDSSAVGINGDQFDDGAENAGAVYVYNADGGVWSQQAYIKASNTGDQDNFGISVTLSSDGDTLAVGALGEDSVAPGIDGDQLDDSAESAGAAYIFGRAGNTWSQQAYVKASNPEAFDEYACSIALAAEGDVLVVGARGESGKATGIGGDQTNAEPSVGAAYVFVRAGASWSQRAYVKASNAGATDLFGHSVALSFAGDTLVVAARNESSGAEGISGDQADDSHWGAGAAYLY